MPGLRVGHDTDPIGVTGCTVVLPDAPAVAAVDVRGGAPGTRETELLRPENTVERVHAFLLTGGSAYGLAAATGVMQHLESRGIGYAMGPVVVPIVPGAVLFDLGIGDPTARPDAAAGERACAAARADRLEVGRVGAGTGATVGKLYGPEGAMKGGIGSASVRLPDGSTVGALVAVNALGDVVDPTTGAMLAGARPWAPDLAGNLARYFDLEGEMARRRTASAGGAGGRIGTVRGAGSGMGTPRAIEPDPTIGNTTIGVVATDVALTKAAALRLAQAAHDGLALAVRPAHTPYDGDTFFALSTGRRPGTPPALGALCAAASWSVALAIRNAVLGGAAGEALETAIPSRSGRAHRSGARASS